MMSKWIESNSAETLGGILSVCQEKQETDYSMSGYEFTSSKLKVVYVDRSRAYSEWESPG